METWFRALGDVAYVVVAAWGVIGLALAVVALIGLILLLATAVRRWHGGRRLS